jgi:hypothetical protein
MEYLAAVRQTLLEFLICSFIASAIAIIVGVIALWWTKLEFSHIDKKAIEKFIAFEEYKKKMESIRLEKMYSEWNW